jgi:hypothetical protein
MSDQPAGVDEARLDIFGFEPRITLENGLGAIARGKHPEDMLHGQPMPADDRLPAEDLRVYRDPSEKLILLLELPLHENLPRAGYRLICGQSATATSVRSA